MTTRETTKNYNKEITLKTSDTIEPVENDLQQKKNKLAASVTDTINTPMDKWAVCATLESLGLRDTDAQQDFDAHDLFDLSDEIYELCLLNADSRKQADNNEHKPDNVFKLIKSFVKYYTRGLSFIAPILGQIGLLFLLRYSLWAYIEFTERQATVVAVGTILSFFVTGGFIQAAGRDVLFYLNSEEYFLARKSFLRLFKYNTWAVIGITLLIFIANLIFTFFPLNMMIISLGYFILLSELWFSLSILYLAKHYIALLAITVFAILPVYLVMENTDWGVFIAHYSGLVFANLLSWFYSQIWFHKKIKSRESQIRTPLPSRSILAYTTSLYFVYGLLYFGFLFVDRIVSWSAYNNEIPAFVIWFRTPYELGMDWALLSFFLTIALLEFTIERFSQTLIPNQQRLSGFLITRFNNIYKRFYRKQFVLLCVMGLFSIFVTYYGVMYLKRFDHIQEVRDFFSNRITYFTFFIAAVSYLFMAIGLLNGLFFLTLSRLNFAIRSIGIGVVVNLFVGLILSRLFSYEYGVFGLLAGSIVYAVVSFLYVNKFFNNLDYFYYSAY